MVVISYELGIQYQLICDAVVIVRKRFSKRGARPSRNTCLTLTPESLSLPPCQRRLKTPPFLSPGCKQLSSFGLSKYLIVITRSKKTLRLSLPRIQVAVFNYNGQTTSRIIIPTLRGTLKKSLELEIFA